LQETRRFIVPSQRERLMEWSGRELVAHNSRRAEADDEISMIRLLSSPRNCRRNWPWTKELYGKGLPS
jgi:hypothetical protein